MWIYLTFTSAFAVSTITGVVWYTQVISYKIFYLLASLWPVVFILLYSTEQPEGPSAATWLGLELSITNYAATIAAGGLTVVMLGGPLIHLSISNVESKPISYYRILISPVYDNLLIRGCMLTPMMLSGMHIGYCIYSTAIIETILKIKVMMKTRTNIREALLNLSSNGLWTFIVSCYLCYIYITTNCMYGSILSQALINFIGVPDLESLYLKEIRKYRLVIILAYVIGGACFVILIPRILDPKIYQPWVYMQTVQ